MSISKLRHLFILLNPFLKNRNVGLGARIKYEYVFISFLIIFTCFKNDLLFIALINNFNTFTLLGDSCIQQLVRTGHLLLNDLPDRQGYSEKSLPAYSPLCDSIGSTY